MKRFFLFIIVIVLTNNVFGQLGQKVQRLCGSQLDFLEMQRTDPQQYQRFMDYEDLLQNQLLNSRTTPTGTISIPVVVHIVYNTSAQNISDTRVKEQIAVLNEDYRRLNADRINTPAAFAGVAGDANIEFYLATIDPNGNPTTGITRTSTSTTAFTTNTSSPDYNNVKKTSTKGCDPWNTQKYLNIWVCNLDGNIVGYSSRPVNFTISPNLDGVVIRYDCFGITGASSPFNKGRTTTHEVGHWLDLSHIWGDNPACTLLADDGVTDTPIQSTANYGCPPFPKTNDACSPGTPGVMFMNYMDYTDDACMNLFTNGQIARMRALFDDVSGIRRQMYVPAIIGSEIVCYSKTYSLVNGQATDWNIVQTGSAFQLQKNGNTATVTVAANTPYSTATLQATVNGIDYSYPIENCAIKGPSDICSPGTSTYVLTTGESAVWSLSSGSNTFSLTTTNNDRTALLSVLSCSGKSGTLKAVANGKTYTMDIKSCQAVVAGPPSVCSAASPSTFVLSMGSASYWTSGGSVRIVSYNSTSCQVEATAYDGSSGGVIAVFGDGGGVSTNVFASCISGSDIVCAPTTYTVNGLVTNWSITQTGSVFSVSPNGNSATVSATANAPYSTATLKATVNGGAVYPRIIENCAIKGATTVYNASTYTLTTGEAATWSLTNGANYFSINTVNNGAQAVVTSLAPTGGTGTIQAVANGKTYTMNIQASLATLDGPTNVCSTGSPVTYTLSSGSAISWAVGGNSLQMVSSTSSSCTVKATADNGLSGVVVAIFNAAGNITKPLVATCAKGGSGDETKLDAYVTVFPNPTSGILNVEIDADAHALELQSKNVGKVAAYEVRLMDSQAITQHQTISRGGTVQFNVSNLPAGIYYLMVYDGISAPLLQQIVVEH